MGLIPKQTKAENKGMFGMSMNKLMGLMMVMSCSSYAGQYLINRYLTIPFIIGCVVIFWQLYKPMPTNPQKTVFYGLTCWLMDMGSPRYYASIISYAYHNYSKVEAEPEQGSALLLRE
jgi:hypothetical protein